MNHVVALSCAQSVASMQLAALGAVSPEVIKLIEDLLVLTAEQAPAEEAPAEEAPAEESTNDSTDQSV